MSGFDDDAHREANWVLVPFVVRLFREATVAAPRKGLLRPGQPGQLTAEAVEALAEVVNQGVWQWLCRADGWCFLDWVDPDTGRARRSPLWEASPPPLEFREETLDLLLRIYRSLQLPREQPPPIPGDRPWGHRLAAAIAYTKVRRVRALRRHFAHCPLLRLQAPFDWGPDETPRPFDPLFEPGARPYLPWLCHSWSGEWRALEAERWSNDPDRFRQNNQRQAHWLRLWIEALRERGAYELLLGTLRYFEFLADGTDPDLWAYQLDRYGTGERLAVRRELARSLVEVLRLAQQLAGLYRECRGVHPADRDEHCRLYMKHYDQLEFDRVAEDLESFSLRILPGIG